VIADIRAAPPTRRVRSRSGNVSGRYPSGKMGLTIQFESHTVELAGIYQMEYDSEVLEYYDQPPSIKLNYKSKNERNVGVWHTPDFFVLRQNEAGWEEWKTDKELSKLAVRMPHRYIKDDFYQWRCLPGEAHAKSLGLYYRLRTDTEINWVLQNNLRFLEDYFRGTPTNIEAKQQALIITLVTEKSGITLAELVSKGCQPDNIYTLLVQQELQIDLHKANLSQNPELVKVFPNSHQEIIEEEPKNQIQKPETLFVPKVGQQLLWNGRQIEIINPGQTQTASLTDEGKVIQIPNQELSNLVRTGAISVVAFDESKTKQMKQLLDSASPEDCAEANRRYQIIAPYLSGNKTSQNKEVSARTIQRWLSQWNQAEHLYGSGYVGLLPRVSQKGNRKQKLPPLTHRLMAELIANDYETYKQRSKRAVYGVLINACEQENTAVPSYKTFLKFCNSRPSYEQTKKRQGSRSAYPNEPFYWELEFTTPRHGDRPWAICHLDHTQLDIELVSSKTKALLGRPWVTFLSDAYSRRILAFYLTFDAPSYRSCMMVIQDCVSRHGRLPQCLVVDGGKEFSSIYFERLLAMYECISKTRPGAKPRFGSVCERLFGTANTMFVHNLAGNTQMTKNPRSVTPAVNPRHHAVWTLSSLQEHLCNWIYQFYDLQEHPALGLSPQNAYDLGILKTGLRPSRLIPYDETFRILTMPTTKKGTAKVIPNQGVKINHLYYWHNSFRNGSIEKTRVSVRYDPRDAGIAYAYVRKQWVRCISQYYSVFKGRSEREIQLATQELRQQYKQHSKRFTITAKALAVFLEGTEITESILMQRLKDGEVRDTEKGEPISTQNTLALVEVKEEKLPSISPEIKAYEEFW
jgi:transposase InsO family protein/transposase